MHYLAENPIIFIFYAAIDACFNFARCSANLEQASTYNYNNKQTFLIFISSENITFFQLYTIQFFMFFSKFDFVLFVIQSDNLTLKHVSDFFITTRQYFLSTIFFEPYNIFQICKIGVLKTYFLVAYRKVASLSNKLTVTLLVKCFKCLLVFLKKQNIKNKNKNKYHKIQKRKKKKILQTTEGKIAQQRNVLFSNSNIYTIIIFKNYIYVMSSF
ncbi:hypothetical protein RFI_11128 [Reticulomyxa filosa]|uniref:Uncharacterized protein n=1 Tax=Reticulomyxa filosa TaxID=46433 RepID=X6NJ38_RETFI|nr:hypothetical protein RFI_11128 [Reticulomyxa filosa]|eukprot:ETO26006.1 hypothetical protein RFI_11128 [Reticulomyxa filosa]